MFFGYFNKEFSNYFLEFNENLMNEKKDLWKSSSFSFHF